MVPLDGSPHSSYDIGAQVDVHRHALKHGIEPEDVVRAATDVVLSVDLEADDPTRQLRLGFDRSGRLLEVVVLTFDDGREIAIHAMKARARYLRLLPGWER